MPGVHVLMASCAYGGFSRLDRYFAAVDWLDAHMVEFGWLENVTGQDYPLRPMAEIESILASSDVDGYLQYAPVFPGQPLLAPTRALPPGTGYAARSTRRRAISTGTGGSVGLRPPSSAGCARWWPSTGFNPGCV